LIAEGQKPLGHNPWTRTKFFGIAKQWQFWVLPLGYFFIQGSFANDQPVFALWLKSNGHTVYERNVWPTGQVAVGVVVQLLAGMLCDSPLLKGRRWPAIVVMQGVSLLGLIILAIWNVPDNLKYFAYFITYFCAGVPGPWYAWYSDLIPHDHEMRGFVIAASNMFSYIMSIWYSLAVWRTIDAPRFQAGFIAASLLAFAIITLALIIRLLQRKDERRRAQEAETSRDVETPAGSQEELDENLGEKRSTKGSGI
jgi:ACS family pantothenate transporter-like MFS transporter